MTDEKLCVEFLFKQVDLTAQCRLCRIQDFRRTAESPELGDLQKIAKRPDFHGRHHIYRNYIVSIIIIYF